MNTKLAVLFLTIGGALVAPVAGFAASDDADVDRSHPKAFVKDSAITTKIKTKLAAEHLSTLAHIKVDTDADGVVWLSGTAGTQDEIDRAVSIAKATEGVVTVKSHLTVKK